MVKGASLNALIGEEYTQDKYTLISGGISINRQWPMAKVLIGFNHLIILSLSLKSFTYNKSIIL